MRAAFGRRIPITSDQAVLNSPPLNSESNGPAGTVAGSKVLLVEDEFLIALDIETAMREAGFDVVGLARTADQAVDFARAQRPALIIMDIQLAGKRDGIDAALDIYRETGIRCIFATAHHDHATKARADPSCPLGWLMKPYTTVALVRMVKYALGSL